MKFCKIILQIWSVEL